MMRKKRDEEKEKGKEMRNENGSKKHTEKRRSRATAVIFVQGEC